MLDTRPDTLIDMGSIQSATPLPDESPILFKSETPFSRQDSPEQVSLFNTKAESTYGDQQDIRVADPAYRVTYFQNAPSDVRYDILQKWECTVTSVDEKLGTIAAQAIDLTNGTHDLYATIEIDEIPMSDRPLIQPGAIFYWSIFYIDYPSGQRVRGSEIQFRRKPRWDKGYLNLKKKQAATLYEELGWAKNTSPKQ